MAVQSNSTTKRGFHGYAHARIPRTTETGLFIFSTTRETHDQYKGFKTGALEIVVNSKYDKQPTSSLSSI